MNKKTESIDLPKSIEAEQAVIGSLILNGSDDSSIEIFETLVSEDFYESRNRILFEIIASMANENSKIDLITIGERLDKFGLVEDAGGLSYLTMCVNNTPTSFHVKQYVKIVREKSQLRKIIERSSNVMRSAYKEQVDLEEVVKLEMAMNGFVDNSKKRDATVKGVMVDLNREISDYEDGKITSVSTGFKQLDSILDGFIVPHVWIIGGNTGTGKTFFTLTLLLNFLRGGLRPVLFSTENSSTRNLIRMIGCMTGFHEMKLFKGRWKPEEKELIEKAKQELESYPLFIYDNVFSTQELRLKAKKHKLKDGANLIVVDYIQQLNQNGTGEIYQQMSTVGMELQRIANELQMGVIAVSQLANAEQGKKDMVNVNFKGAGEIRAVSDVSIALRRHSKDFHKLAAEIIKVRHGVPGRVVFDFFGDEQKKNGTYIEESKGQI